MHVWEQSVGNPKLCNFYTMSELPLPSKYELSLLSGLSEASRTFSLQKSWSSRSCYLDFQEDEICKWEKLWNFTIRNLVDLNNEAVECVSPVNSRHTLHSQMNFTGATLHLWVCCRYSMHGRNTEYAAARLYHITVQHMGEMKTLEAERNLTGCSPSLWAYIARNFRMILIPNPSSLIITHSLF